MELVAGTYEINHQFDKFRDYIGRSDLSGEINWIDTAITYNNDEFIKPWTGNIISKISPFMTDYYEFFVYNHLKCLDRYHIDIMLVHNTRHESWLELYGIILKDSRFKSVGISNASIDDLKAIKDKYGSYPEWVEIEINPRYYIPSYIEFCRENGIKIISYAIFGGKYRAKRMISSLTIPFLLKFASEVSDMCIVRWDSDQQMGEILEARYNISRGITKFHFDFKNMSQSEDKSIIPNVYLVPDLVKLDFDGFPIYFNEDVVANISHSVQSEIPHSYELKLDFEFITEFQAFLRYSGRSERVAIIDELGRVTKVNSKNSKILVKWLK